VVVLLVLVVGEIYLVGRVVPDWGVELILLIMPSLLGLWVPCAVPANIRAPGGQSQGVEASPSHTNTQAHVQRDEGWVPLQTGN